MEGKDEVGMNCVTRVVGELLIQRGGCDLGPGETGDSKRLLRQDGRINTWYDLALALCLTCKSS